MRSDIVPGAVFPDYELSDHTGKYRKLSELQGQHPMIVVLTRGGYCPKDRQQAEGLLELHREMEVGYCRLVTISTDNITETSEYRSGVGAHWPFLSDVRRIVQEDLDMWLIPLTQVALDVVCCEVGRVRSPGRTHDGQGALAFRIPEGIF